MAFFSARSEGGQTGQGAAVNCDAGPPAPAPASGPPGAGTIAADRGVGRAQIALAWLRRNPVVVAPLVGATKPHHIEDAVASLEIELTDDEVAALERPYTPRRDWQGVSDPAELARISNQFGIKPA